MGTRVTRPSKITKRSHALTAPVQSFEFKVLGQDEQDLQDAGGKGAVRLGGTGHWPVLAGEPARQRRRVRSDGIAEHFKRKVRRQVAAEHGQVGRSTQSTILLILSSLSKPFATVAGHFGSKNLLREQDDSVVPAGTYFGPVTSTPAINRWAIFFRPAGLESAHRSCGHPT